MMLLEDKSNTYTGVGIGASGVGSLVSILAFALPYWIYYDEDLTLSDTNGSYQVQFTYYYGFWNYCNKVLSDISNSDICGSVETHSDVEQTTATLLLVSILLFVSAVVNGCLYLTAFKKERLCLYIAWMSAVVAGILALASIIMYAQTDHSVTVTNITLNFSASKLHASFWLVVTGCFMVAIATIFITLAIIHARRIEDKSDDKKSMFSYDSVDKETKDNDDIPEEYRYKDPSIPEAFPYTDSPYSTSSESMSEINDISDSDDSDIDPKLAKLKTKLTLKSAEPETLEIRRCKSGEPPKTASSSLYRSRSATDLTPVEQPDSNSDFAAGKLRVSSGKRQIINLQPCQDADNNPLYSDMVNHFEPGTAPVATDLIFAIPRPVVDSSDGLILRRAKTDMSYTQKMRDTLGLARNEPLPTDDQEASIREPAEIVTEATLKPLPFKRKPPQKKGHKPKPKKLSKEELQRHRELTDIYSAPPPIKTFIPEHKPAPWSKARAKTGMRLKTPKSMKWSLEAYGADFAKLSKQLKLLKRKHRASSSPRDSEQDENLEDDNSDE